MSRNKVSTEKTRLTVVVPHYKTIKAILNKPQRSFSIIQDANLWVHTWGVSAREHAQEVRIKGRYNLKRSYLDSDSAVEEPSHCKQRDKAQKLPSKLSTWNPVGQPRLPNPHPRRYFAYVPRGFIPTFEINDSFSRNSMRNCSVLLQRGRLKHITLSLAAELLSYPRNCLSVWERFLPEEFSSIAKRCAGLPSK